jgi:hypothetical protein
MADDGVTVVAEFHSQAAASRALGVDQVKVSSCILGKTPTADGFRLRGKPYTPSPPPAAAHDDATAAAAAGRIQAAPTLFLSSPEAVAEASPEVHGGGDRMDDADADADADAACGACAGQHRGHTCAKRAAFKVAADEAAAAARAAAAAAEAASVAATAEGAESAWQERAARRTERYAQEAREAADAAAAQPFKAGDKVCC